MNDKLSKIMETPIGDEKTVKEYFKDVLLYILIENPPKRMLGESDWWHRLTTELARIGSISGGVEPCCKKFCDDSGPCGYDANLSIEELKKELKKLIKSL